MGLEALPFQGLNNTTRPARLTQWSGIKRFPRRVKHINFASSLTLSPFLCISNKQMHDKKKKKSEGTLTFVMSFFLQGTFQPPLGQ